MSGLPLRRSVVRGCALAALLVLLLQYAALVQGGYSFEAPSMHPDWEPGIEAIQRSDWKEAIEHLAQVVRNEPDNADAHALLGLAYQRSGDLKAAFKQYDAALRRAPDHRLAHRHLGEAYLEAGNKAKAKQQLARLVQVCGRDCDEYRALAAAVARAK